MSKGERWVTREVLAIIVAQVVFGLGWSLYLLIPKFLATELHAGPELVGHAAAAGGLAGILVVPIAAVGIDRYGRTLFFRLGTSLVLLASLGYLQVREVGWAVYLLQGCVAAAFTLAFNANAALLADFTPPARLGQAIGWLGGANVLTNAVSTMIAEPLAMRYGWHVVFELGAVLAVLALALSLSLRGAKAREAPSACAPLRGNGADRAELALVLVATVFVGAVFIGMFVFVQPYALARGAREVREFFLGFTISAVGCRVLLGGLGDRFGRRRVSRWLTVAYGLSALLTMRLQPDRLVLYGLAFGAAHGLLYPTMNALVLQLLPASRRGLGMALYNGAFNVGAALASLGFGVFAARHGYPAMYAVAAGLAFTATIVLSLGRGADEQA